MARGPSQVRRPDRTRTMPTPNAEQLPTGPILPQSTRHLVDNVAIAKRHPGLQLDKLSPVGDMKDQKPALEKVVGSHRDGQLLADLLARRDDTLKSLNAQRLPMATRGSLTLHLSRSGALENAGIALHPIYGFVYLPGSGVKGLARAYAETVWAPSQPDKEKAQRQIEEAFGWSRRKDSSAGRFVFHDAWPLRWPELIVDVVNNHHRNYYDGKDDPGDWENPIPVYFLAVGAGNQFDFAISDRERAANDNLLKTACGWLRDALTIEGAGAKTAAGYGRFKPVEGERAPIPKTLTNATYELRLASPAFLAGANQKQEDCDLRSATLRGLLRWWWRTMHAGHLDRKTLKQLETAVWGDAESGSPVRIAVDSISDDDITQHPYKNGEKSFAKEHRLPKSPQKTIQGLFYASYGVGELKKGNEKSPPRWFRPAGSCWRVTLTARDGRFQNVRDGGADPPNHSRVTLTARDGRFQNVRLQSDILIEQASVALWLLAHFGGAGSRSRKGFGSFDGIEVEGIGSKEDCIASAKRFRELYKLEGQQGPPVKAPALEEALIMERDTVWTDPWYALDQIGTALQSFAKNKKLKVSDRIPLGLPRRKLKARKGERHASPALWSLTTRQDGQLTVRLIAFPAAYLPDKQTSTATLQQFIDFARQQLQQQAEQPPQPLRQSRREGGGSAPPPTSQSGPKANDRVEAKLLEEKTKKGGWKAKHLDSGLQGPIQDSQSVPADAEPGQHVELTVAYVSSQEIAFKWSQPSA